MGKTKKFFSIIQYNSPVILTYALICLIALGANAITKGYSNRLFFSVYRSPIDAAFFIRLFGHAIGHISLNHYFSNFILILLVGPMLEEKYTSGVLALTMFLTALITGFLNLALNDSILLGASGIAFMMIILASFANIEKRRVPLTFILILIIYLGQEIVLNFTNVDNVSHFTHIVGGVFGSVVGFVLNNKIKTGVPPSSSNNLGI
jgi:membrane associated rhomboid family serine protease